MTQSMESKEVPASPRVPSELPVRAAATGCCGSAAQSSCCEPSAKAACCGDGKGQECGCK
jgi:hypothetical protein